MVLRNTRIAPTVLTQVGHEGNPSYSVALTVAGTLDPSEVHLSVAAVEVGPETRDAAAAFTVSDEFVGIPG